MLRVKAEPSNEFKRHLEKYGILGIERIFICRKPLMKGVEIFINAITLGKYDRIKKEQNYDQIFHLYLMILLSNGMWMLLEKNEQVVLKPSEISEVRDFQHIMILLEPNVLSLREFVENAIQVMGNNEFFIYDGLTSNCQMFVTDVLRSNNLWDTGYDLFVNQPITTSLEEVKGLKTIMRKITDLGAITKQIMGKGMYAGTDESFLIDDAEMARLRSVLKSLREIDFYNIQNRDEAHEAFARLLRAKKALSSAYGKRPLPSRLDGYDVGANFINTSGGFSYIPSFDEEYTDERRNKSDAHTNLEINKNNKKNLKDLYEIIENRITRILDYNSSQQDRNRRRHRIFESHDVLN